MAIGRKDSVTKAYMGEDAVFADAFNYFLYQGSQVLAPEDLKPLDTAQLGVLSGTGKAAGTAIEAVQKYRDVLKIGNVKKDDRAAYLLLGVENQSQVHYAMPVRNLVYDALQYPRQVEQIAADHRRQCDWSGHSRGEYLSGFYKKDQLLPVITLAIFFSPDRWDGPMTLHDMMSATDPELLKLVQDYRIHLIEPAAMEMEDFEKLCSSLREVLAFIKYSRDPEKLSKLLTQDPHFEHLDRSAAMVISACTHTELNIKEDEEAVNMCQAIEAMKRDSREAGLAEGRAEGRAEGKEEGMLIQARATAERLAAKGFEEEQIAEILGYGLSVVRMWIYSDEQ